MKWNDQQLCCQTFDEEFEEMLTKPTQSEVPVIHAFGTNATFGQNVKMEDWNLDWSRGLLVKILEKDWKKCWQNPLKVRF